MDLRPSVDVGTTAAVMRVEPAVPEMLPPPAVPVVPPASPAAAGLTGDDLYQAQLAAISNTTEDSASFAEPLARDTAPTSLAAEEEEQAVALLAPPPPEPAPAPQPAVVRAPPPQPQLLGRVESRARPILAAYPRVVMPKIAAPNVMPPQEVALRKELKRLGVRYKDMPPIDPGGGACGIDYPVKVMRLSGGIDLKAPAVLNATIAVTFARYVRNDFAPAVRWRYLSGIRTIYTGSTYACRNMIGESTHHLSEHAKGNAIDVMKIKLENGKVIDVTKPGFFAFRQRGFLDRVRAEACEYFTTVLGPGYNRAHANHFHFDLKHRRNGYVACR